MHPPRPAARPLLPIIVTGYSDAGMFQARDAGVNEYVTKPMSAKTLMGRSGGDRTAAPLRAHRQVLRAGPALPGQPTWPRQAGTRGRGWRPKAAPPPEQHMGQDEINALFTPTRTKRRTPSPAGSKTPGGDARRRRNPRRRLSKSVRRPCANDLPALPRFARCSTPRSCAGCRRPPRTAVGRSGPYGCG